MSHRYRHHIPGCFPDSPKAKPDLSADRHELWPLTRDTIELDAMPSRAAEVGNVWPRSASSAENRADTTDWVWLGIGCRRFFCPEWPHLALGIGLGQHIRAVCKREQRGTWSGPLRGFQPVRGLTLCPELIRWYMSRIYWPEFFGFCLTLTSKL